MSGDPYEFLHAPTPTAAAQLKLEEWQRMMLSALDKQTINTIFEMPSNRIHKRLASKKHADTRSAVEKMNDWISCMVNDPMEAMLTDIYIPFNQSQLTINKSSSRGNGEVGKALVVSGLRLLVREPTGSTALLALFDPYKVDFLTADGCHYHVSQAPALIGWKGLHYMRNPMCEIEWLGPACGSPVGNALAIATKHIHFMSDVAQPAPEAIPTPDDVMRIRLIAEIGQELGRIGAHSVDPDIRWGREALCLYLAAPRGALPNRAIHRAERMFSITAKLGIGNPARALLRLFRMTGLSAVLPEALNLTRSYRKPFNDPDFMHMLDLQDAFLSD